MIGEYKKIKIIGEYVWLVVRDNKQYAAKIFNMDSISETKFKENAMLRKEIKSSYVVEQVDTFKDEYNNSYVVIIEYCSGIIHLIYHRWKFS